MFYTELSCLPFLFDFIWCCMCELRTRFLISSVPLLFLCKWIIRNIKNTFFLLLHFYFLMMKRISRCQQSQMAWIYHHVGVLVTHICVSLRSVPATTSAVVVDTAGAAVAANADDDIEPSLCFLYVLVCACDIFFVTSSRSFSRLFTLTHFITTTFVRSLIASWPFVWISERAREGEESSVEKRDEILCFVSNELLCWCPCMNVCAYLGWL